MKLLREMCSQMNGGYSISASGREHVMSFWEYAAFLANSAVFILIGGHEASQASRLFTPAAAAAIGLVLIGRIAAVYPLCAVFARSQLKVDIRHQHVLVWGGLRGALALALALAIPDLLPEKDAVIIAAFAVVAFSIFAQGLTMPWLIRTLDLARKSRLERKGQLRQRRLDGDATSATARQRGRPAGLRACGRANPRRRDGDISNAISTAWDARPRERRL